MKRRGAGTLSRADIGTKVLLQAWVQRRRDHGGVLFLDLRDRSGVAQVVAKPDQSAEALAALDPVRSEWVVEVFGTVIARDPEAVNPKMTTGEVEVLAERAVVLSKADPLPFAIDSRAEVAEETRLKYRFLDLRRPELAKNFILRHEITHAVRGLLPRAGLPRHRDADPDQVDSRRRARLSRAVARPSRRVLRPAAVAAALQAAAHDRRIREVHADRALLPRRGPARRPPAGVHPDRPRDVVPDRGGHLRAHRRALRAHLPDGRHRGGDAVPAPDLRRRDGALRQRQARPAVRRRDPGRHRGRRELVLQGLSEDGSRGRRGAGDRGAERRRDQPLADRPVERLRQEAGAAGGAAAQALERRALVLGQAGPGARRARGDRRRPRIAGGRDRGARGGQADGGLAGARRAAARARPAARLDSGRPLRVPLGDRVPAARVGGGGEALVLDASSVHLARPHGGRVARGRPRGAARPGLRRRAERHRARRRLDPHPRPRRAIASLPPARHRRGGGARALRLPARRAATGCAAARRAGARPRPHRDADDRRAVAARRHRLPEDRLGELSAHRRRRRSSTPGSCASSASCWLRPTPTTPTTHAGATPSTPPAPEV